MARESGIQSRIVRRICEMYGKDCQVRVLHGSEYSVEGDPDIWGCVRGRMIAIEVKQPGQHPRPIQVVRLRQWKRAGAVAFWATGPDEVEDALRKAGL